MEKISTNGEHPKNVGGSVGLYKIRESLGQAGGRCDHRMCKMM